LLRQKAPTRLPRVMQVPHRDKRRHIQEGWDLHQQEVTRVHADVGAHRVEPYSFEEALVDALSELPTPLKVKRLIELLRSRELKEVTEGVLNDCSEATRTLQPLNCANAINSWVATAEEMITNRRTQRYILAARDESDALVRQVE
jgi:hypothetical protein